MTATWIRRWLPVAALALTLLAVLDPLEGFPLVLMGGVLTAMAAIQDHSRWRKLAVWGVGLAALGCAEMVGLSFMGGVGGTTGRSMWWLLVLLPYPIGVLMFRRGAQNPLRAGDCP
jgi:hypothetical protein